MEGADTPLLEVPPFEASGVLGVRELGVLDPVAGVSGVTGVVVTPLGVEGEAFGDEGEMVLGDCGVVESLEGVESVDGVVTPLGEAGVVSAGGLVVPKFGGPVGGESGDAGTQAPPFGKVESNRICDRPRFTEALTSGHER